MRDCFEPGLPFSSFTSAVLDSSGFAAATPAAADDTTDRFFVDFDFTDFDIEILRSVHCSFAPHHRSPTSATKPAGQDLGAPFWASGIAHSTAPFAPESQSFLNNVGAQFGGISAENDRATTQLNNSVATTT
jgi:hypothetical protein